MKTILTSAFILLLLALPQLTICQTVSVSGKVLDSSNDEALMDISVFEPDSKIGTITNEDGFFRLLLSPGMCDIQISAKGFQNFSQKLTLQNDTTLLVHLEPEMQSFVRARNDDKLHAESKTPKKK